MLAAHRVVLARRPGFCGIPRNRPRSIVDVTGAVARRPVVPLWRARGTVGVVVCAAKTTVVVGSPMAVALALVP